MGKGNGGTRASGPAQNSQPQTFEQQVDNALVGLKTEFFQRMEDYYEDWANRWKKSFTEWKEKEDYIMGAGSSAKAQQERASEFYEGGTYANGVSRPSPLSQHDRITKDLRDNYSNIIAGGYYKEGAKAPSFYDLARGRAGVSEMNKAIKATAERAAEKSFTNVRTKMLKTTVEKGIDLKNAKVRNATDNGFLISDGKVTLHARYILAWGEIKAPHFRFIITDRKS